MSRDVSSFLVGILIIAGIYVLVRPNSQGPSLLSTIFQGLTGLLSAATGGTGFGPPAPAPKKK